MKYDIITIGGATEDITFYTKEGILIDNKKDVLRQKLLAFEYGAKVRVDESHSTFGGGAANTAVSFSRLGFRAAAIISIGQDLRGKRIIENLKKQKVNVNLVQRCKNLETGFSFLLVGPSNEHVVFSNRAANQELKINNYELKMLKNTKWAYLTSLTGKWQDVLNKVIIINNIKIAWNPGHIQLKASRNILGKYLKKTTVLFVNKDEAIELVISDKKYKNKDLKFLDKVNNLLKILKSWGPEIVVITSGKQGADAYNGISFYHQDILKEKKRVDTTGVGDAFGSSFIAGLELYHGDIAKAMKLGVKNTASVIAQQGAQNGLIKM
ncbi:MAG: carbohydrate kinase family protein [Patescibacteria group bacterium]